MNTCDTCKWWGYRTTTEFRHGAKTEGEWNNICQNRKVRSGTGRKDSANETGGSPLATGPKFGCIHHEAK